jgi:transcriptional regulator with XRE-family HTH domain
MVESIRACIARNVESIRKERALTQAQLANVLREQGTPIDRASLSKIERPSGRKITVDELLALAIALEVAPINLTAPWEIDDEVELPDGSVVDGLSVRRWLRGYQPLPGRDPQPYFEKAPRLDWFLERDSLYPAFRSWLEDCFAEALRKGFDSPEYRQLEQFVSALKWEANNRLSDGRWVEPDES